MNELRGTAQTLSDLADEIIARLDKSYELVYVGYNDKLSDDQVAALVRGDSETLDESLWEFEADSRYEAASRIIADEMTDVLREWENATDIDFGYLREAFVHSEEWDYVRFAIEDRGSSDWVRDLCRNTGRVLLRINVIDEDHCYSFEEVAPDRVAADLGFEATPENLKTIDAVLRECSPEYSVLLGYWIAAADFTDLYALPWDEDAEIELVNPYLYLGNPFVGSGYLSDQPLNGVARVKRGELRTDKDAFGYSIEEVFGGLRMSDFEVEIRQVKET